MAASVWTKEKIDLVKAEIKNGLTNKEIAEKMGFSRASIAIISERRCGGNPNYRIRQTKHKHISEEVFKYFLTHSKKETIEKFKITESEFKSIFTYGYKRKELSHLRKDTRQNHKRFWTENELLTILQMSGIRNRTVIANKLDRGNSRVIKEYLQKRGLMGAKYTNGLSLTLTRELLCIEPEFYIDTDAGPSNLVREGHLTGHFKIIPWVYMKDLIDHKQINPPEFVKKLVEAMSAFQEWIHQGNAYGNLLDQMLEVKS